MEATDECQDWLVVVGAVVVVHACNATEAAELAKHVRNWGDDPMVVHVEEPTPVVPVDVHV